MSLRTRPNIHHPLLTRPEIRQEPLEIGPNILQNFDKRRPGSPDISPTILGVHKGQVPPQQVSCLPAKVSREYRIRDEDQLIYLSRRVILTLRDLLNRRQDMNVIFPPQFRLSLVRLFLVCLWIIVFNQGIRFLINRIFFLSVTQRNQMINDDDEYFPSQNFYQTQTVKIRGFQWLIKRYPMFISTSRDSHRNSGSESTPNKQEWKKK
ncbi:hypothetical protein APICC_02368 [Apis cerana cerana]|uniref:Uncharacterized protein n=1 Tax=Apis cerana cerana TaxID=94128 RepID=A0A2A3ESF7_APICC|nr:hypothetical protein APICC_02368 [Apis cerana cerana]